MGDERPITLNDAIALLPPDGIYTAVYTGGDLVWGGPHVRYQVADTLGRQDDLVLSGAYPIVTGYYPERKLQGNSQWTIIGHRRHSTYYCACLEERD